MKCRSLVLEATALPIVPLSKRHPWLRLHTEFEHFKHSLPIVAAPGGHHQSTLLSVMHLPWGGPLLGGAERRGPQLDCALDIIDTITNSYVPS